MKNPRVTDFAMFEAPEGFVLIEASIKNLWWKVLGEICNEPLVADEKANTDLGLELLKDHIYGKSNTEICENLFAFNGSVWNESKLEEQAHKPFNDNFPGVFEKRIEVNQQARELPETAGFTLAPFKFNRRHFYKSDPPSFRFRKFCVRPEHSRLPDKEFERSFKNPEGINIYNQRLGEASREGFNHMINATVNDILKIAASSIEKEFYRNGFHWTNGIVALNESLLIQFEAKYKAKAESIIRSALTSSGKLYLANCSFEVNIDST